MPGPGGSLGTCAICGNTFMKEILLGKKVKSFFQDGIAGALYAHDQCLKDAEKIKDWKDLPIGPLREAFERHNAKFENATETVQ